ncbi:Asp23/Gls24 family envelope stress response protein [Gordonia sp. MP11Mi]|uniref:Asp23/Gls24 family envelope stress response protein n=1 Tax=Gordonia sp. MP11Mi TaxID=3022769 RepID=A0AA97CW44_9ACTN
MAPLSEDVDGSAAEQIADAVLALPGVVDLHSGLFGEVATYLPGRRVTGVAVGDEDGEVHIIVDLAYDLQEVAASVRDTAESITGLPFAVIVEDIEQVRRAG